MQVLFKHLPRQRSLSEKDKENTKKLLELRANKKLIRQQLTQVSGKIVLLKDISNIASQAKEGKSRNDLTAVVKDLIEQYGKYIYTERFNIFCCFRGTSGCASR